MEHKRKVVEHVCWLKDHNVILLKEAIHFIFSKHKGGAQVAVQDMEPSDDSKQS